MSGRTERSQFYKMLAVLAILALALAACVAPTAEPAPAADGDDGMMAESSSISFGNFNPNYAANVTSEVADEKGWLAEGGITSQEIVFMEQSQIFPALIGGSLHIAAQDTDAIAAAILAGEELLYIANYRDKEPWILAFAEGVSIDNLDDVTCSGGGAGGRNEWNAKEIVVRLGGDPEQIEWVPIRGGSDSRVNAFAEGQINCVQLFDRHRQIVADSGGTIVYDELEIVPQDGFIVMRSFAEANPRTIINYLKGLIQGRDFFRDEANMEEVFEIMRGRDYEIPDVFIDQYPRAVALLGEDGYFTAETMETMLADAVKTSSLEGEVDWGDFVDLSYLNTAYEELGMADRIREP